MVVEPTLRDGTLALAGGRSLSYALYGDVTDPVVVYCHGYPTCRMELELIEPMLRRHGVEVCVIALDRPGYGGSTFQSGRTFLDWPRTVAGAMDSLGVGSFSVLGVSGGAPYAMACASGLPSRVSRLGVAVGVGPPDATSMERSLIFRTAPRFGLLARVQFALFAKGLEGGKDERIFEQTLKNLGSVDVPILQEPRTKDWFIRMLRETFKQGGKAAALEIGLYLQQWGFDPSEIETETYLWYGGRDETVPAPVGQWLAERIPNSTIEIWPEHGHFTWMLADEVASVVAALVTEE